jgi:hypothetical protein
VNTPVARDALFEWAARIWRRHLVEEQTPAAIDVPPPAADLPGAGKRKRSASTAP